MKSVLQGEGTASCMITNSLVLKIQLADEDDLLYQFIDVAEQKVDEIIQVPVTHVYNENSDEEEMAFFLQDDDKKETPYFISEFIRDGYPAIGNDSGVLPFWMGEGLPVGRITEMYGKNIIK